MTTPTGQSDLTRQPFVPSGEIANDRPGRGQRVFLIGFSGTGKSSAGQILARKLGWRFYDLDDEIVSAAGQNIPTIFREEGEEHFRQIESRVLAQICRSDRVVVATGGGVALSHENCALMMQLGTVVALDATPRTLHHRLTSQIEDQGEPAQRPLIDNAAGAEQLAAFRATRLPTYAFADYRVDTEGFTVEEVANRLHHRIEAETGMHDSPFALIRRKVNVQTPGRRYTVVCGRDVLDRLPEMLHEAGISGPLHVVTDEHVGARYGERLMTILTNAGFAAGLFAIPAGEPYKNAETLATVYDWLVERGAERRDTIIAFGGGVVGDLAGYAAATYLRGLLLIQLPTTLLAQVDSSVGGKVGINHRLGKNLIGAFYQPALVMSDLTLLSTLPPRELAGGWAEVIKYAVILDRTMFDLLEREATGVQRLDPTLAETVIGRCVALKAEIVSDDEREQGRRAVLNFGHTVGHALEAVTDYERFTHGEAVAVGMVAASHIAQRLGMFAAEEVERLRSLIERFNLPTTCDNVPVEDLLAAIGRDKKARGGAVRWVLPRAIGQVEMGVSVPMDVVRDVLVALNAEC